MAPLDPFHRWPAKPLIVRLRNWVGEIMLSLPALQALEDAGYALHLFGPPWARSLLGSSGWPMHDRAAGRLDAIRQLRALTAELRRRDAGFDDRANALIFTRSFSSAFEARCAGLRAVGRAADVRSPLLKVALPPVAPGVHVADEYWQLAWPLLEGQVPTRAPEPRPLELSRAQHLAALKALATRGIHGEFIVCCPLSGAGDRLGSRRWPHFAGLSAALHRSSRPVVICPGPGEEGDMHAACPHAIVLTGLDLGTFAALMQLASLVVANDTGPGHVASLVGARLVSVFGPHSLRRWHPLRADVVLHPHARWPTVDEVLEAVHFARSVGPRFASAR